ncbi:MAG: FtsX-like permease family protein [Saprospiraceae bacterium]
MLQNYLKIALRNSWKNKTFSGINIFGLAMSLAATLLILLWVKDEAGIDRFHEKGEAIQKILMVYPQEGGKLVTNPNVAYPMIKQIEEEVPEVEEVVYLGYPQEQLVEREKLAFKERGMYANSAMFSTFSFPILIGDRTKIDETLNGMAISESMAKRFFGRNWEANAIGELIRVNDKDDFIVEAVFKDIPANSSLKFDFVANVEHRIKHNEWLLDWGNKGMAAVILLREDAEKEAALEKINAIYKTSKVFTEGEFVLLQNFQDGYLYSQFSDRAEVAGGRIEYVRLFSMAALLLLVIACINFVNLTTVRASKRAKEVGVRKTIGASKSSLISQFLVESTLISIIAIGFAVLLAEIGLPTVRILMDKSLFFDYQSLSFWLGMIGIVGLTAFLSGVYPAFVLSSYKTINVLKGKFTETLKDISLRKILVVTQFVLALILVVGAMVIQQQISYIKNKNIGIDREHLIYLSKEDKAPEKYEVLRTELLNYPGISSVTAISQSPIEVGASTTGVEWAGKRVDQRNQEFKMLWVEENFLDGFKVSMTEGRFYDADRSIDTSNIVLNETAIRVMGLENPVGKRINWWGNPVTIIGVVKDFHVGSLYEPIEPLGIILEKEMSSWLFIRTAAGKTEEAINGLQAAYNKVFPDTPLDYKFLDEQYQNHYKGEVLTATLAKYFAFISILISCLGLFGLSTFLVEQKTKEIGVRKVMGASMQHIIGLLSRDFLLLVGIGLLMGIPISWYLLHTWLGKFAYGVDLEWWMFAIPVFIAIGIAFLTVGFQSLKAATANPVEALRAE